MSATGKLQKPSARSTASSVKFNGTNPEPIERRMAGESVSPAILSPPSRIDILRLDVLSTCSPDLSPNLVKNSRLGLAIAGQGNPWMKTSRFSEQQIAFILKQAEDGTTVEEVCRKAGISVQTYYRSRSKYGGLTPSEMKRLKQLEEENVCLKRLVANLSLDKEMLQDVIRRKM